MYFKFMNRLVSEYERWFLKDRSDVSAKYLFARSLALTGIDHNENRAIKICIEILNLMKAEHYRTLLLLGSILYKRRNYDESIKFLLLASTPVMNTYLKFGITKSFNLHQTSSIKLLALVSSSKGIINKAIQLYEIFLLVTVDSQLSIRDFEKLAEFYVAVKDFEKAEELLNDLPAIVAAKGRGHHLKMVGIIETLMLKELQKEFKKNYSVELIEEMKMIYKSAKFAFEQFLDFFPNDKDVKTRLFNLKKEFNSK